MVRDRKVNAVSTKPTTERNPGFEGMDARRKGLPLDACPYPHAPSPQRTAWVVGWYIAAPENQEPPQ
jgi:ribosome modulation factor